MSPKSLPIPTVQPHSVLKVSQNDRFTSFSPKIQGWHMVHPYYLSGLRLSDTKGTLCPPPPPPPLLGTAPQGQQYSHLEGGGGATIFGGICNDFRELATIRGSVWGIYNLLGMPANLRGFLQPYRVHCNLTGFSATL